jgi:hypothetical protein
VNVKAFVQEVFKVDRAIRYVGIVDSDYHVLVSEQREGVSSYVPDEMQKNFVSIVPEIILESVEKLSPFLGEVSGVTAHYDKALVIFYRFLNLIVVLSFQAGVETPFYNRITEAFGKLSAQYLK